jgi:hypothetical protein
MEVSMRPTNRPLAVLVALAGICLAGCSGSDGGAANTTPPATVTVTSPAAPTSAAPSVLSPEPTQSSTKTSPAPTTISKQEATALALARTKGGRANEVEADDEDDRPVWKVKIGQGLGMQVSAA